jgi:integrase
MYLEDRRQDLADATLQAHRYRLQQFVAWCEQQDIDNLNQISGRELHRFRVKRRDDDGLATATMKGQLATLRAFLRFCAAIEAVPKKLDEKIILPTVTEDDARTEMLSAERAEEIISHLDQYEYGTLKHALIVALWNTGMRVGAARGLDVDDYDSDDRYLVLEHAPADDTPLKNGAQGERVVAVSERLNQVLGDWIEVHHPGTTDQYDRTPLFATNRGRISPTHARTLVYQVTRPCSYTGNCPHDRDLDDCPGLDRSRPYECPSSLSPHPMRRGAVTYHLQQGTPEPVVSDRMDVSPDVIDRHYDQRSPEEKMRQRRQYLPDG